MNVCVGLGRSRWVAQALAELLVIWTDSWGNDGTNGICEIFSQPFLDGLPGRVVESRFVVVLVCLRFIARHQVRRVRGRALVTSEVIDAARVDALMIE